MYVEKIKVNRQQVEFVLLVFDSIEYDALIVALEKTAQTYLDSDLAKAALRVKENLRKYSYFDENNSVVRFRANKIELNFIMDALMFGCAKAVHSLHMVPGKGNSFAECLADPLCRKWK